MRPAKLKKFYLVVARRVETQVLEEVARMGTVQLIRNSSLGEDGMSGVGVFDRFQRMDQKCATMLAAVESLKKSLGMPTTGEKKLIAEQKEVLKTTPAEIQSLLDRHEKKLDDLARSLDRLQREVEELRVVRQRLQTIVSAGMDLASIGEHRFLVVKSGLASTSVASRIKERLTEKGIVCEVSQVNAKQSLLTLAGFVDRKEYIDSVLSTFDFEEFDFPSGLPPNPRAALKTTEDEITSKLQEMDALLVPVRELAEMLAVRKGYVEFLKAATVALSRTQGLSMTQGWVLEKSVKELEDKIAKVTSNVYYFKTEDPAWGEEVPVVMGNRGWFLRNIELLTTMLGMPSYNEIDPTLIFALLFPVMYGIMFGDVGDGLVILGIGLLFYRLRKPFLGISNRAIKSLGVIMMVGGISAVIFGFLYGSFFLLEGVIKPRLFSPVDNPYLIIEIALVFGVVQLTISLILNIFNQFSRGNIKMALLSGKGLVGLVYYLVGVVLAVRLIQSGLQFSAFVAPENIFLTLTALGCLIIMFLSPTIRSIGKGVKLGETITEGFGEFIEVFLSYITNSISYLRLAAFAIAHGIFAGFALQLGTSVGLLPSYLLVNSLVVLVEGFAAGIQSIRLLYYEFSTKFFVGSGTRFKPFTLANVQKE